MRRLTSVLFALAAFASLVGSSGCLANTYRVRQDELMRLATLPPEARGQRVRVVQDVGDGHHPDRIVEPRVFFPNLIFVAPVARPIGIVPTVVTVPSSPRTSSGSIQTGGGDAARAAAVLLAVAAIGAAFAVVGTEGARFDGWAQVDPNAPVYLRGPGGETVVPLASIDPSVAAWASGDGFLDQNTSGLQTLETGPLDRVGGTFAIHMGAATAPLATETAAGFLVRPEIGGFPIPEFGLKAAFEAGFGSTAAGYPTTTLSVLGQVQVMPIPFLGAFGQAGFTSFDQTLSAVAHQAFTGTIAGGGLILELGLNARLAAELRVGANIVNLAGAPGPVTTGFATLGLAVY